MRHRKAKCLLQDLVNVSRYLSKSVWCQAWQPPTPWTVLSCLQGYLGEEGGLAQEMFGYKTRRPGLKFCIYDKLAMWPSLCHWSSSTSYVEWGGGCIRVAITEATSNPSSVCDLFPPARSPAPWIHRLGSIMALWLSITRFSGEWRGKKRKAKWHSKIKQNNESVSLADSPGKRMNLFWTSCESKEKPLISEPKLFVYCLNVLSPRAHRTNNSKGKRKTGYCFVVFISLM